MYQIVKLYSFGSWQHKKGDKSLQKTNEIFLYLKVYSSEQMIF